MRSDYYSAFHYTLTMCFPSLFSLEFPHVLLVYDDVIRIVEILIEGFGPYSELYYHSVHVYILFVCITVSPVSDHSSIWLMETN